MDLGVSVRTVSPVTNAVSCLATHGESPVTGRPSCPGAGPSAATGVARGEGMDCGPPASFTSRQQNFRGCSPSALDAIADREDGEA